MMTLRDFPAIMLGKQLPELILSLGPISVLLLWFNCLIFTAGFQLDVGQPINKHST